MRLQLAIQCAVTALQALADAAEREARNRPSEAHRAHGLCRIAHMAVGQINLHRDGEA